MKNLTLAVLGTAATLAASSAMANNLFGIDVSSYQGSINWSSVKANGANYAFAKATEGNYFQDGYFKSNMTNGKAAGLHMGAYDFCRPDQISYTTEANYFWSFAGGYIKADAHSLFPMLDFETYNGHVGTSNYTQWMNGWSSVVKSKTSTFLHPVIYTSAGAGACDLIEYDKAGGITLSAWIANYNGENLYTGNPWSCCTCCNAWVTGCGGGNWTYWQVSSTGSIGGISGSVDFDAYAGTAAQLASWQGVGGS
jgi:lysozyme